MTRPTEAEGTLTQTNQGGKSILVDTLDQGDNNERHILRSNRENVFYNKRIYLANRNVDGVNLLSHYSRKEVGPGTSGALIE